MVVAFVVSHWDYIGDSLCDMLYRFICSDAFAYKCGGKGGVVDCVFWLGKNISI